MEYNIGMGNVFCKYLFTRIENSKSIVNKWDFAFPYTSTYSEGKLCKVSNITFAIIFST